MAGIGFGMPSPGATTLTERRGASFSVDSFFDISYQIAFVGAPGSVLDGLAGSTPGVFTMVAEKPFIVADGFSSGDTTGWSAASP